MCSFDTIKVGGDSNFFLLFALINRPELKHRPIDFLVFALINRPELKHRSIDFYFLLFTSYFLLLTSSFLIFHF